eukprot:57128-Amphidinium_carterae.1
MKWLGDSSLAFMAWIRERLLAAGSTSSRESIVIIENVIGFEERVVERLLGAHFDVQVIVVSPTTLGLPVERRRKYLVLLSRSMRKWRRGITDHQACFEALFGSTCSSNLSGDHFMRARSEDIASAIEKMAHSRNMPLKSRSGRGWSWFQALSPSLQASVEAHEKCVEQHGHDIRSAMLTNLLQRPEFMKPNLSGTVPALLKSSSYLWSFRYRRSLLGAELFEVQGHVIYEDNAYTCDFLERIKSTSEQDLRKLVGNSMHLAAVGAVLLYSLACSQDL